MKNKMPNTLPNGQGSLNKAGDSSEPGGARYMDIASGKATTVFEGLIINTGPRFSLVAVKGNQVLNRVRVEHTAVFGGEKVTVGDSLLIGTITIMETGPVATKAWPFRASGPHHHNGNIGGNHRPPATPPPRSASHIGTVSRVHPSGKFAEVLEDRTGHRYFAHMAQFKGGARMTAGFRITFSPAKTERGPVALDIKPQN